MKMKRRNFIGKSIFSIFVVASFPAFGASVKRKAKSFRVVHVTDMHIAKNKKIERGVAAMLNEINTLVKKPDFVLNTGDNISDALKQPKEQVQSHWHAWTKYFKSKLKFPLYSCIGNHDVWGWGLNDDHIKTDSLFGKAWPINMLELENRYYSFEHKNWKFICLDSSMYDGSRHSYTACLDEEQFKWLETELQNTENTTPVCVVSHIPILSASVFYDGNNVANGNWQVPGSWMHIDSEKVKDLFYKYKNVKVALSGHVHLADKTEYLGVRYICNGAASGGWWKGPYQEFGPAYATVDFFEDGPVESKLVPFDF